MPLLVLQVRADYIFTSRTDGHAISRLVIRSMAEALPHGRSLEGTHAPAIIKSVPCVGDLLDPVGEAAEKFAIIVREARREVKRALRTNRSDRASRNAELALKTGVVIQWAVIVARITVHQHRAQQHKVAELRMNQVPVNAHVPKSCLDRDRLV